MPRGDGTGPDGKGPRTGRSLGRIAGNPSGQGLGQPRRNFPAGNLKMNPRNTSKQSGQGTGRGRNN
jgi:hypothetical protein